MRAQDDVDAMKKSIRDVKEADAAVDLKKKNSWECGTDEKQKEDSMSAPFWRTCTLESASCAQAR